MEKTVNDKAYISLRQEYNGALNDMIYCRSRPDLMNFVPTSIFTPAFSGAFS